MREVASKSTKVDDLLLKPAQKDIEHYIRKLYEDDPNKPFTIRMSSISRPLCMLQMEKAKAQRVEDDWNLPLRFMFGGVIEGLAVSLLRHAGVKIDEEQTHVKLPIAGIVINGTLDLVIDGKVWDIKSASPHSFNEKFASYEALKEGDVFGYLGQLYGYSAARGLPPGGWIVIDKSSGNVKVVEVPSDYTEEMARCLKIIEDNVTILVQDKEFKRCFEDIDEKFKKQLTGNKMLGTTCGYCPFRYSCWPSLQYLPVTNSTAFNKPYRYYTKITSDEISL